MMERSTIRTVVFRRPFTLVGVDGWLPAGTYSVETDEQVITGLSFLAYRRLRTTMTVSVTFGAGSARQVVTIDPDDLEAALARDALEAEPIR